MPSEITWGRLMVPLALVTGAGMQPGPLYLCTHAGDCWQWKRKRRNVGPGRAQYCVSGAWPALVAMTALEIGQRYCVTALSPSSLQVLAKLPLRDQHVFTELVRHR